MSHHQRKGSRVKEWLFRTRSRSPTSEPPSSSNTKEDVSEVEDKTTEEVPFEKDVESSGATAAVDAPGEDKTDPSPLNLWEEAKDMLGEAEKLLLESNVDVGEQDKSVPSQLQALVLEKQRTAEEKAWKFDFGGRRIVLRDVVEKIVGWTSAFKALGDGIAAADPIHAGLPWAAIKMVLQFASADLEQNAQILVTIELVTCLINRGKIYEGLYLSPDLMPKSPKYAVDAVQHLQKSIAAMYSKILFVLISYIKVVDRKPMKRVLNAVLDPGSFSTLLSDLAKFEDRCELAASNCERHVASTSRYLQDANYQKLRVMLIEHMQHSEAQMSKFWKKLDDDERCKIFLWISEVPFESDHYTATKGRVEGTGEWLLDHETYNNWRSAESSTILWLHGIPGAGKTKLSSKVIDNILSVVGNCGVTNAAFAYFYCDRNRTDHRDPVVVLRSLVRQLSAPRDESAIIPYIEAKYTERKRSGFSRDRLTNEECHDLLLHLTKDYSQSNIVIDGLDECDRETRYVLMDVLDDIVAKSTQPIKVYIASRQDQDLRNRYQARGHLEVTANHNQSDIEKFVLNKMEQSPFCRSKMTPQVRQEVLRTFQDKSQGMFQWAALHIDELLGLDRNKDILAFLDKLPRGLEAAYHKIFGNISTQTGSKRDVAFAVFKILMCSWRPLSPEELIIAATQVPEEDFCIDPDVDINYVRDACRNFMVVTDGLPEALTTTAELQDIEDDKQTGKSKVQMFDAPSSKYRQRVVENSAIRGYSNSICRFSHLSVREYLELHHWSIAEANAFMAVICLRTMLRLSLDEAADDEGHEFEECPVLNVKFADKTFRRQMVWHDSDAESNGSNEEDEGADQTGTTTFVPPPFKCFLELSNVHYHSNISTCSSVEMEAYLHKYRHTALERWTEYASETWSLHVQRLERHDGLTSFIDEILCDFLGEPGLSSSHYQAWTVFIQATRTLANVYYMDQSPRTLLRPTSDASLGCALLGLNYRLDAWLRDGKAVANTKSIRGDTLLLLAINGGHIKTCQVLLTHGADPNEAGFNYMRPLQAAVSSQRLDMVKLLLKNGADPDMTPSWQAEGDAGKYPLAIAAAMGSMELTKALLEGDASIWHSAALQVAAEGKHYDIVESLLETLSTRRSWEPDWTTKNAIRTIWTEAISENAGTDVLELLISHNIDTSTQNSLHTAVEVGNETAVVWLLRQGWDVNQKAHGSSLSETPLVSLMKGFEDFDRRSLLETLLAAGADVHTTDTALNTPLSYAVEHNRTSAVQRLLGAGAQVSTTNKYGESPLLKACAMDNEEIVKALLEHGADANEVFEINDGLKTPLMEATKGDGRHHQHLIVHELVKNGAKYKSEELPERVRAAIPELPEFESKVNALLRTVVQDKEDEEESPAAEEDIEDARVSTTDEAGRVK